MANLDKDYYLDEQGLQTLINELETNLVALEYSASATYAVGDYCVHDNKMYRCTTAISTAESWDSTHWSLVIIGDELKTKKSGTVTSVTIKGTSPIVSSSESAITTSGTRTISHADSGVTAGTYNQVTVDAKGHVTSGTNTTQVNADWNSTSGVSEILNKPTLGTASAKDVPTSGDASTTEVVMGSDSRLTDSRTPTSHTHGNITNAGALQTTDITIANGDKLVVTDASNSNKIARTATAFDGSTTTTALTPKGTFETFLKSHQTVTDNNPTLDWGTQSTVATIGSTDIHVNLPANPNTDTKVRQTLIATNYDRPLLMSAVQTSSTTTNTDNVVYRNNSIYANPSTGTITATKLVGDISGGTNLSSTQVTNALGYTPYDSTNPAGYTTNTGTVTSVTIKGTSPISSSNSAAITGSGETTISLGTVPIANGGTGATTALGATDNLGALNWGEVGTSLTSGTNVDTDLESGKTYYSASSSASQALAGTVPTTESGFKIAQLTNYSTNYTIQIATALNGNVWIREKYRDGSTYPWGDWRIFYTSSTLTSRDASSGGTAVSLVTTGEKYTWNNKVDRAGDTMTGNLTIKVTSTYDDNSPSRIGFQAVDSTNSTTSTATISAYNGGGNGANLVIQPGGNMFLGSGEAAYNHYNAAYTHSTTEVMFITSDNQIHIQSNGQTIANRVGVQIDSSGNLVPDKADVATNNIGGIGTSTYKWANGYFTNINGVAVGDSPKFTDTWRTISINSTNISDKSLKISAGTNVSFTETTTSSAYNITINATDTDTKVTQSVLSSTATNWRKVVLGYSGSSSAGASASDVTDITYVDNALEYKPDTETLKTTNLTIAPPANNATFPSGGINVHDLRGYDSTVPTTQGVNFFFSNNTMPTATWWSGIYVKGYSSTYAPWEIVGYAANGDGRTQPLYVRTANKTTAWGDWRKIYDSANPPTASDIGALPSTTTYAGSSTVGGSATSAVKLDTATAGSATQPCYFTGGQPSACTYSLNKTVPSDAVFTDENVKQSNTTATSWRKLVLGSQSSAIGTATTETTAQVYVTPELEFCPDKNVLSVGAIRNYYSAIQTGETKASHITLQTLMTWLISTKKWIPSDFTCHLFIHTTTTHADNDILQFTAYGIDYECQLSGCHIEFMGYSTGYNKGQFRLIIHTSPKSSFTPASGYTAVPTSSVIEYWCTGSSNNPIWKIYSFTTYTFTDGTNGFTVTPSGGSPQTVTVTPSIPNNITGSGTSGYLTKFNGTNTITNGPQLGSSTSTYLNNSGAWSTPDDTKNTAGSTDISSKIFLIGATSQADNPQTYSDDQVYATSGTLYCNQLRASAGVYSNTGSNTTSGGLSLWGTSAPEVYGVSMRTTGTASGELGKHGYVTGTHAIYFCMNTTASSLNRGWVFRHYRLSENVASINTDGNAVFNGSVTIGGNSTNDSGCRLTYNSTTKSCDFVFA